MAAKKSDTEATSPAELEATGIETVPHTYKGHTYTVPATVDDWPIEALEAAEKGSPTGILRHVLGEDQYELLKQRNNTVRDLRQLSNELSALSGFDAPGN